MIEPLAATSPPVTPGVADRAMNELILNARKNRKFASTPATRLKSALLALDCRDRAPDNTLELTTAAVKR